MRGFIGGIRGFRGRGQRANSITGDKEEHKNEHSCDVDAVILLRRNPGTAAGGWTRGDFVQVTAHRAQFQVALKGIVGLAVQVAQDFKLLHVAIVFFRGREKPYDAGFENLVRAGSDFLQFNTSGT
jgi:hypothetical protein